MPERVFSNWRAPADCANRADESIEFMRALYPICRSITGDGLRDTLRAVGERVPLAFTEVPSGERVFDWEVPQEWNIRGARIKDPNGRTVVDFAAQNLHVVNYSVPIVATMSLEELRPHLHSLPAHPTWIPYRTSYYHESWGFCLSDEKLKSLTPGDYRVRIDSSLEPGSLTYAEAVVRGASTNEFLIYTHACHPSLCNDNLTGIAIATQLARELQRARPRFTYRFVFAPGTIGSITWLARNEANVGRIRGGLVLGLLGDRGPLTYKRSRRGNASIDRICQHVLPRISPEARIVDFSPYGYDERQLCSPGFNLPVGRLTRSQNGEYAQYHSSADDFSIVDVAALAESLFACAEIIRTFEGNAVYTNLNSKCEPRLGKRGLYHATGGVNPAEFEHSLLWILNQSDGANSLLDIAERSRLPFAVLRDGADALCDAGLLRMESDRSN